MKSACTFLLLQNFSFFQQLMFACNAASDIHTARHFHYTWGCRTQLTLLIAMCVASADWLMNTCQNSALLLADPYSSVAGGAVIS
jgi:hypothetical protein